MNFDLTNFTPEELARLERALTQAKASGAGTLAPRPPQLEDIKPGMTPQETKAVCDAIRAAIHRD
ncbi:MAG TPA: hypothetical protein PLF84_15275 [Bryobacteraceae bacterium]|nr:hypothetical protein [Bryobacterales bacterium]HRJ20409.1 hypothetical protein [Bryobacteraceae bacterium]